MLKIGLTGGIGSGKTTVARIFEHLGYKVYIADIQASRLMNTDPQLRRELSSAFGKDIYTTDRQIDKKRLASLIFNNREALRQINRIVHPCVVDDFNRWCEKQPGEFIFFESAILFEAGLEKTVDSIICVYASPETRIKRVMERDHTTGEKVRERMAAQMGDEEKCRRSDFTICTDNSVMVLEQIETIIEKLKNNSKHNRPAEEGSLS